MNKQNLSTITSEGWFLHLMHIGETAMHTQQEWPDRMGLDLVHLPHIEAKRKCKKKKKKKNWLYISVSEEDKDEVVNSLPGMASYSAHPLDDD